MYKIWSRPQVAEKIRDDDNFLCQSVIQVAFRIRHSELNWYAEVIMRYGSLSEVNSRIVRSKILSRHVAELTNIMNG